MTALIIDHVFRASGLGYAAGDDVRSRRPRRGRCCWLGTCDRPEAEHITPEDYRRARRSRATAATCVSSEGRLT